MSNDKVNGIVVLTGHLLKYGINVIDIRRLARRHTGKPTHIVKIKCSEKILLDSFLTPDWSSIIKFVLWKKKDLLELCAALTVKV